MMINDCEGVQADNYHIKTIQTNLLDKNKCKYKMLNDK